MSKQHDNNEEKGLPTLTPEELMDAEIAKLLGEMPVVKERTNGGAVHLPGDSLVVLKGKEGNFAIKPFTARRESTKEKCIVRVVCVGGVVKAVYQVAKEPSARQMSARKDETLPGADGNAWKQYLEGRFYQRHIL